MTGTPVKMTKKQSSSRPRRRRAVLRSKDDNQASLTSTNNQSPSKKVHDFMNDDQNENKKKDPCVDSRLVRIRKLNSLSEHHPIQSADDSTLLEELLLQQITPHRSNSKNLLLALMKRCLKMARSATKSTAIIANIELTWLGLQSILLLLSSSKTTDDVQFWESIAKLFYHLIQTSSKLLLNAYSKSHDESRANIALTQVLGITINASRSLGKVFCSKLMCQPNLKEKDMIFPIPVMSTEIESNLTSEMIKIGISCSHSIATLLTHFSNKNQMNIMGGVNFRNLSMDITLPWISLLFVTDSGKNVQEAITHCKRVHKLIWDVATKQQKQITKEELLELQRDAILALFLNCSHTNKFVTSSALPFEHVEHYWNQINTMAWNSAIRFSRICKPNKELLAFHSVVGDMLDDIYQSHFTSTNNKEEIYISYVEYCSIRAFHQNQDNVTCKTTEFNDDGDNDMIDAHHDCSTTSCIFANLPFTYIHSVHLPTVGTDIDGSTVSFQAATLSALFFIIHFLQQKFQLNHGMKANLEAMVESVSRGFISCFVSNIYPLQERAYKLLTVLRLHSYLSDQVMNDGDDFRLFLLGKILVDCWIPFVDKLSKESSTLPHDNEKYKLVVLEGLLRAAAVFNTLGHRNKNKRMINQSNVCLHQISCIIYDSSNDCLMSSHAIEIAAKVRILDVVYMMIFF